ncbi:hypothetical protein CYLTODRAFT_418117 [Cylindrobasidium torrendii FP15055 ss-10]|uniref:P-loop containing nucleoside triphosphate hydrolase protein n=1 Tax=Cylindrobasidium torrendii FP15055 ss-10 TaxID=1314674 RepID=A0A0D7BPL9_9AGAR|nr:hypothetical protein CYLTODRAFT_418117 [Cylindrobasidium torrendii FP15055 ss-10]
MSANTPRRNILDALNSTAELLSPSPGPRTNGFASPSISPEEEALREAVRQARIRQMADIVDIEDEELDDHADLSFLQSSLSQAVSAHGRASAATGGFRVNYDQGTVIRAIDVGGVDQDQKISEFISGKIDNASHGYTVASAMERLGMTSLEDIIHGLEVRLLRHQVIGLAWMLDMEHSEYKGGILADDMGLGKTVEMIATMVKNMPAPDSSAQTTLIVVPAALMLQWKEEVEQKTNGSLSVHIYHGKDKLKKLSDVKKFDVIVTTYQTLSNDFVTPSDIDTIDEAAWLAKKGGPLARCIFHRVVADEAQYIRNRGTKASISMAYVRATYRWTLTGTPITNSLADIYGFLRFGRFRPWNDWNSYNEYICKVQSDDAPLAGMRAQGILSPLILRRTKESQLEGKAILDLKPKDIELVELEFSDEEREVYKSFEVQSRIRINRFIKSGKLVKNHTAILVMILRLRQLCCHPHLILAQGSDFDDPTVMMGGDADAKELSRALKQKGNQWITRMKARFMRRARAAELEDNDDSDGHNTCPMCNDMYSLAAGRILGGCAHEMCDQCLDDLRNAPPEHNGIFGYGSEKENEAAEKRYEEAAAKGHRACPKCKTMQDVSDKNVFKAAAFQPTDEDMEAEERDRQRKARSRLYQDTKTPVIDIDDDDFGNSDDDDLPDLAQIMAQPAKKKQKTKRTQSDDDDDATLSAPLGSNGGIGQARKAGSSPAGKRKAPDDEDDEENEDTHHEKVSDATLATWRRGDDDMEPSTKMMQLIEYIKDWESTGDKIIVYSQWTSNLDLLETLFARHGVRSLRFDGKMDRHSRDSVLKSFKQPLGPRVILISTKSGGVGLNLTAANRIVNMDLSWNYAAESQAYDRAHRIGQDKPVWVKRLVVKDTIEQRMLKLQEVKVGLAEAALGEGTGKLHKLSVKDIKFLFGFSKAQVPTTDGQDDDDRPVIGM